MGYAVLRCAFRPQLEHGRFFFFNFSFVFVFCLHSSVKKRADAVMQVMMGVIGCLNRAVIWPIPHPLVHLPVFVCPTRTFLLLPLVQIPSSIPDGAVFSILSSVSVQARSVLGGNLLRRAREMRLSW